MNSIVFQWTENYRTFRKCLNRDSFYRFFKDRILEDSDKKKILAIIPEVYMICMDKDVNKKLSERYITYKMEHFAEEQHLTSNIIWKELLCFAKP